ncbi:MAG: hypothetical protein M1814_004634 [Vezdaea aestivalis]|nr:MAG: hypothetical protein M1814_004634 [Vezdaea aestivalis]
MNLKQITKALSNYSVCDVSDALVKIGVEHGGFLRDINTTIPWDRSDKKRIAPAFTVSFRPKSQPPSSRANIPKGCHYVDLVEHGKIPVLSQPKGQDCAVLGGIMALRMKVLGAVAVVIDGRARDLVELDQIGLNVWSNGTSTVGAAAEAVPDAINVPIIIGGVEVTSGDILFLEVREGGVAIPQAKLEEVLKLLPTLTAADDKVKKAVADGMSVSEAFERFRGK